MEKISNFFCSSKDSSKKPRLPILVLKQSPTSGFISKISTPNFSPILTKTHSEAITAFNQSLFPIVIAALGIMQDLSDHYNPLLTEIRKKSKACFIIIFSQTACNNAKTREICFDNGANMVTNCLDSLSNVLSQIYNQISNPGQLTCPICLLANLSEDSLWYHLPLYHINDENIKTVCPLCKNTTKPNLQVHYHNSHGPCARKEVPLDIRDDIKLYAFSLVIVHRKKDNKFLLVQEFAKSGFWLPGGGVDLGENLIEAGVRETKEEAGVDIKITGVLSFQYTSTDYVRLRVIFYGEPVDENQKPKSVPDYESAGASYVTYEEIKELKLRGSEPLTWIGYVNKGKMIYPVNIFSSEND